MNTQPLDNNGTAWKVAGETLLLPMLFASERLQRGPMQNCTTIWRKTTQCHHSKTVIPRKATPFIMPKQSYHHQHSMESSYFHTSQSILVLAKQNSHTTINTQIEPACFHSLSSILVTYTVARHCSRSSCAHPSSLPSHGCR